MKYRIYKLNSININNQDHVTLETPDFGLKRNEFDTIEKAHKYLTDNIEEFEYDSFVVLPYIHLRK